MTFFPFGIPSTSSFAENAQRAINLYTPSYSAANALVARRGPPGPDAPDPTDDDCPTGYTSAILPTPGYAPVPSNANVDRSAYVLCFQLPATPTPTPSVTRSPTPTPTPSPSVVCPSYGTLLESVCLNTTFVETYADGVCGEFQVTYCCQPGCQNCAVC